MICPRIGYTSLSFSNSKLPVIFFLQVSCLSAQKKRETHKPNPLQLTTSLGLNGCRDNSSRLFSFRTSLVPPSFSNCNINQRMKRGEGIINVLYRIPKLIPIWRRKKKKKGFQFSFLYLFFFLSRAVATFGKSRLGNFSVFQQFPKWFGHWFVLVLAAFHEIDTNLGCAFHQRHELVKGILGPHRHFLFWKRKVRLLLLANEREREGVGIIYLSEILFVLLFSFFFFFSIPKTQLGHPRWCWARTCQQRREHSNRLPARR